MVCSIRRKSKRRINAHTRQDFLFGYLRGSPRRGKLEGCGPHSVTGNYLNYSPLKWIELHVRHPFYGPSRPTASGATKPRNVKMTVKERMHSQRNLANASNGITERRCYEFISKNGRWGARVLAYAPPCAKHSNRPGKLASHTYVQEMLYSQNARTSNLYPKWCKEQRDILYIRRQNNKNRQP